MATKAIITRRGMPRTDAIATMESSEAENLGLKVEQHLPQGTLVRGDEKLFTDLEKRGYRVKVLPETNILAVGSYRIDTEAAPPKVPAELEVPKALEQTWSHYLVQLAAPPNEEWIRAIEDKGVDVVEPISAYGLFVVGTPDQVSKLKNLPFMAWVGPFKPAYRLSARVYEMIGTIQYVSVGVLASGDVEAVRAAIINEKGKIILDNGLDHKARRFITLIAELPAISLTKIASLPDVRWVDYHPETMLLDERSCQIVAGDLNANAPPNTGPNTGYPNTLTTLGMSGNGVRIAICDSGVDTHNNATMQADLAGGMSFFADQTGGSILVDRNGHGTHVAGIAVGSGATGDTDPQGFVLGQGVAPAATFGSINAIAGGVPLNLDQWVRTAVTNNCEVMNNSWGTANSLGVALFNQGYTDLCRTLDGLVRDPNSATAALENLVIVFAAGNAGSALNTIQEPNEAKNTIVVGNSLNFRPGEGAGDDIRGLAASSGRGPAVDGRILPNIVAPGTNIISVRPGPTVDSDPATPGIQRPRTAYTDTGGTAHNNHFSNSGTSMAAPHVAGLCALIIERWRKRTNGKNPSPAFLKALLIIGAVDCVGGPDGRGGNLTNIPNNDQGWGRVSAENIVLQVPASDRGPKIFSDQRHAFTTNGQEHTIRFAPVDTARPLRITLVWTDAAGAANANPALVNDLDLEVTELATGKIYKGNKFANGFSTTGGAFNNVDNIECVYLQNPNGTYEVSIIAATIAASAHPDIATPWQDFALVIDNAEFAAAAPVSVVPVVDRSGSMVYSGYVDVTKTSSKQFVDLMSVDDKLGVVSFGSTAEVEYPAGPGPTMQTITGQPIKDAAKTEIDGIAFGGCTFMGQGIIEAQNLLAPVAGTRAMVLLSDGYDNKGCDEANPAKPSALDAVAGLPADLPVYTCAMGPASDQTLLANIANQTNGLYYYMPTIDDLREIYNYIRGQITGDAIIVNESATASSSRVAAFVDALATEVTFTVAWDDKNLRFVAGDPKKKNEVSIRLRDPGGRLLHPHCSYVHRIVGDGYVVFKLQEPTPGQWYVKVKTVEGTHVRYTVGGFVRSPLMLAVTLRPRKIKIGIPLQIAAQVFDGKFPIAGFRANSQVVYPDLSVANLLDKYKSQLGDIQKPDPLPGGDTLPLNIGRLMTVRAKMLKAKKPDLFAHLTSPVSLRGITIRDLSGLKFGKLLPSGILPVGPEDMVTGAGAEVVTRSVLLPKALRQSGVLAGQFNNTQEAGSYNVVVTARGTSPVSKTRFVRKALISVLVR